MAVLERDIFDVRSIDIAEQSDPVLIYVPYVKPLNRVSDAVKISHKLCIAAAITANRMKALYAVRSPVPCICDACVDIAGEHISAVHLRRDMLELVDVMHAHIVIVRMRKGTQDGRYIPPARCCRCGGIRMCVVGNIVRRCRAVHVEVPRRFIADIVADVRRIQAANLDILPPPERCAVCIRHRTSMGSAYACGAAMLPATSAQRSVRRRCFLCDDFISLRPFLWISSLS